VLFFAGQSVAFFCQGYDTFQKSRQRIATKMMLHSWSPDFEGILHKNVLRYMLVVPVILALVQTAFAVSKPYPGEEGEENRPTWPPQYRVSWNFTVPYMEKLQKGGLLCVKLHVHCVYSIVSQAA